MHRCLPDLLRLKMPALLRLALLMQPAGMVNACSVGAARCRQVTAIILATRQTPA